MTPYLEQEPIAEWVPTHADRAPTAAAASSRHASLPGFDEYGPAMLLTLLAQCVLQQSALAFSPHQFKRSAKGLLRA